MLSDATMWFLGLPETLPAYMVAPWVIALALAALTLLLEDAAIAAGILLAGEGIISWPLAFVGVAGGIACGDMLLYLVGAAARRLPLIQRHLVDARRSERARRLLDGNLTTAVLIARVVPGLRLALYTACGLLCLPFASFALLVAAAVAIWTAGLFWLGAAGAELARHWSVPAWPTAIVPVALLGLVPILTRCLTTMIRRYR